MCGILAILLADSDQHCRQELFDGLTVLQHRGQDAAGIVTANTSGNHTKLNQVKNKGMVRDVFSLEDMLLLEGNLGVAHCRYPTSGRKSSKHEAQPLYLNYPCGLAIAHNGNLTNTPEIRKHVTGLHRHLSTFSDSEALLNVFAEELRLQLDQRTGERTAKFEPDSIFEAIKNTMKLCKGGYACVLLIHDVGIVAFRDPDGIRPLVIGKRKSRTLDQGIDYVFSSESVASDVLGFELIRDVKPGEAILVIPMDKSKPREDKGLISRQLIGPGTTVSPCLFEYVYFARPDSVMNGVSVYESRYNMGVKLAGKIKKLYPNEKIDAVIPIPETSRISALALAKTLNLPYCEAFCKNRYIGRTFIMPEQTIRRKSVRLKLNTVKSEFQGKNVLLVDDSIVRGTTSTELVLMAREAGAAKVFFTSAAPEIRFPNVYGIDLPTCQELVAFDRTTEEIAKIIGADWVLYQDLDDLESSVRDLNADLVDFEGSTFSGKYITNDVDLDEFINKGKKEKNTTSAATAKSTKPAQIEHSNSTVSQIS